MKDLLIDQILCYQDEMTNVDPRSEEYEYFSNQIDELEFMIKELEVPAYPIDRMLGQ